jgi:Ca2+-binding EF-hand superfamily protein
MKKPTPRGAPTRLEVNNALREIKRQTKDILKREKLSLQAFFAKLDRDADLNVSYSEFQQALLTYYPDIDSTNKELVNALFKKFNSNNDLAINFQEFATTINEQVKQISVQQLLKKIQRVVPYGSDDALLEDFKAFDRDGDSMINYFEFSSGFR